MRLEPALGRREYRDLLLAAHRPAQLRDDALRRLAADAGSPIAAKDLGAAWLALGEPAEAAKAYRLALDSLPAYLTRIDPGHPRGLTTQEADLLNLLSVAERRAGHAEAADQACARITARQPRTVSLDVLCEAYRLEDAGRHADAVRLLQGYQPPAPEHEALVAAIAAPIAMPDAERRR
jgi:tetratricopeptide (TPR) repeat protein